MITTRPRPKAPAAQHLVPAVALALALAGVLAGAGASVAQDAGGGRSLPLTLDEAVARALETNDDVRIERSSVAAAEAGVRGAEGAYDPVLSVDGGWRRLGVPVNSAFSGAPDGELAPTDEAAEVGAALRRLLPTGGSVALRAGAARTETDGAFGLLSPAYDSRLGIELRQPLLRDRAVDPARLGLRVAAAERDRAVSDLRREVLETVAAVEEAYWNLVAVWREAAVREDAVELAAEQLEETRLRIEGGVAPETEIAQPRAELERRRVDLLEARERAARAENALKLLILGDDEADLWARRLKPVETPGDPSTERVELDLELDLEAAMADALAARPELDAFAAAVDRRGAEAAFARNAVLPELDLVVSYDRFGLAGSRNRGAEPVPGLPAGVPPGLDGGLGSSVEQLADGDFDDARVGLVLEVPLGNRAARAEAAIAAEAERRARSELDRARKAIRADVLNAAAALEAAGQRIEAARAARRAAQTQLRAERERYAVGLSTNFLVLTRQNDLANARLAEIEALTDYRAARTGLARATGSLLTDRGIAIEDGPDR